MSRSRFDAVVFDLDDTLYDCMGQCVVPAHREAAAAMVAAGLPASVERTFEERMARSGAGEALDRAVAEALGAPDVEAVAAAGRRAFFDRDPGPVAPHPFTHDVLRRVRARARTALITTGIPRTQRLKIERLGLDDAFDVVLLHDLDRGGGKEALLRELLGERRLDPARVLVVGDRPSSEIAAARRLGCAALRIRAGEFSGEPTPAGVEEHGDLRAVLPRVLTGAARSPAGEWRAVGRGPRYPPWP